METLSLEERHGDDKGQQISFALERFHLHIRKIFFFLGRAAILWNNPSRDMAEKFILNSSRNINTGLCVYISSLILQEDIVFH